MSVLMELLLALLFLILVVLWRVFLQFPGLAAGFRGRWRPVLWILLGASVMAWLFFVRILKSLE